MSRGAAGTRGRRVVAVSRCWCPRRGGRCHAIAAGSRERQNYDKFGQWPVLVDDGSMAGKTFQLVTRDNIPFFDPIKIGARTINATITGNLRQVAFDDRSEPLWIVEPRDQQDCTWCKN